MNEEEKPVSVSITLQSGYGLLIEKEEAQVMHVMLATIEDRLNELAVEDD